MGQQGRRRLGRSTRGRTNASRPSGLFNPHLPSRSVTSANAFPRAQGCASSDQATPCRFLQPRLRRRNPPYADARKNAAVTGSKAPNCCGPEAGPSTLRCRTVLLHKHR